MAENKSTDELDSMTLNIEFTLISIIQGVALYFLTENARAPLINLDFQYWPYIFTALITIFTFWSRSILHTLTVIRWPLGFLHNFMYIACTLVEAILFTQLNEPIHWFALNALYSFLIWLLFTIDLPLIDRRLNDSTTPSSKQLYTLVKKEQRQNIRFFVPIYIVINLLAWGVLRMWGEIFIQQGWHVALAIGQAMGSLVYLILGIKLYSRLVPMITQTRHERE